MIGRDRHDDLEPLVHSGITDGLLESHPLAREDVLCVDCKAHVHAFNNELMQDWLEWPDGTARCWDCGTKVIKAS